MQPVFGSGAGTVWGNGNRRPTKLPRSWPRAHQIDKTVSRYWCVAGMNSGKLHKPSAGESGYAICGSYIPKKTAESTGRLPPTPMLHIAAREHNVIEFGEAPPDRANTPVMKSVRLKDNLICTWIYDTEGVLKGRLNNTCVPRYLIRHQKQQRRQVNQCSARA
jgi:hypothetical protein